jgi:hypothetical protein
MSLKKRGVEMLWECCPPTVRKLKQRHNGKDAEVDGRAAG